jgi:hypothetical protein
MKISMHAMSVGLFVPMLRNLGRVLDKGVASAAARHFEPAVLAGARLAPDMFPLTRQVQLACDFAKNSTARLAGQEPPRFEDTETTVEELKARIDRTIAWLGTVPPAALEGAEDRDVRVPLRNRTLEKKGLPFLQEWALPNFYFHVTAAYAILRNQGVDVGKQDYLGG